MDPIRAFVPDVVLCHYIDDFLHPDHVEAPQGVLWAALYCPTPGIETSNGQCPSPDYVCSETQLAASPVTNFLPNFFVDINSSRGQKIQAMKPLVAQPSLPMQYEVLGRRAFEPQLAAGMTECTFAEGFCRVGTDVVP